MVEAARDLREDDPLAVAATAAIRAGDVEELSTLLAEHAGLAQIHIS